MISLKHIIDKINELTAKVNSMPSFEWATVIKVNPLTVVTDVSSVPITGASLIGKVSTGDRVRLERQGTKAIVWAVGISALGSARELAPDWTSEWGCGDFIRKYNDRFEMVGKPATTNYSLVQIYSTSVPVVEGRTLKLTFNLVNRGSSPLKVFCGLSYYNKGGSWKKSNWSSQLTVNPGSSSISYTLKLDFSQTPDVYAVRCFFQGDQYASNQNLVIESVSLVDITNITAVTDELKDSVLANVTPPGSITAYIGSVVPSGWLLCDGKQYNRSEYPNLATALGVPTTQSTFKVPDLRGRFLVGAGSIGYNSSSEHGSVNQGEINLSVGVSGGEVKHRLTTSEMPSHDHGVQGGWGAGALGIGHFRVDGNNPKTRWTNTLRNGGDSPHNNMPPYVAINWIIHT